MKNVKFLLANFFKGILAGLAIGLGGFLYVLMTFALKDGVAELGKILGSTLFAIGLFLVCTFSLSLYTGKIGLVFEEKKDKWFYISLPIMLIGNAIGAFGLGYIFFALTRIPALDGLYQSALSATTSRLALNNPLDYLVCALKSFLCGFCVYTAVKCFNLRRLKPLGILLLVFFVFVFVYCGFQHCIANMFYFGMANAFGINPINTLLNLLVVIVFNSFGPIVGVLIWKLFKK